MYGVSAGVQNPIHGQVEGDDHILSPAEKENLSRNEFKKERAVIEEADLVSTSRKYTFL